MCYIERRRRQLPLKNDHNSGEDLNYSGFAEHPDASQIDSSLFLRDDFSFS